MNDHLTAFIDQLTFYVANEDPEERMFSLLDLTVRVWAANKVGSTTLAALDPITGPDQARLAAFVIGRGSPIEDALEACKSAQKPNAYESTRVARHCAVVARDSGFTLIEIFQHLERRGLLS